jgi:uncharacterized protein DUF3455
MTTEAAARVFAVACIGALVQSVFVLPKDDVPNNIKAPAGEKTVYTAYAKGVQVYACQVGSDGKYSWVLKEPRANLLDQEGKPVGLHFAGPTWKLNDGSEVTGKIVAKHNAPKSDAIPWLLLKATSNQGHGYLEHVTTIQRVNTSGGLPKSGSTCDETKRGTESESEYSAIYYFYAPES